MDTFGWDADPVEVAGEFFGDIGLTPGWQPHCDDDCRAVGHAY